MHGQQNIKKCWKIWYSRNGHSRQYNTAHAHWVMANIRPDYVMPILLHYDNGYRNAPQCYVIRALPVLFGHLVGPVRSISRLKPNDPYMGRTAPLTSKRCILYIYSTNIGTEYFKKALYSPFLFLFKMQFVS